MTTCALDLSDFIDVSQLPSEPGLYSDLRVDSLGSQAALQPLPIWRALRCQNEPLELLSDTDESPKPAAAAAFSAWSDPTDVFLSNGHLFARSPSAFDILSEPSAHGPMSDVASAGQIGSGLPGPVTTPSDQEANDDIHFKDARSGHTRTNTSSPGADTQLVSSVVAPDLHEVDQEQTTTKYDNHIHDTSVEDEVHQNNLDAAKAADDGEPSCNDQEAIDSTPSLAGLPLATPLSDRSLPNSHPGATALHKAPQLTEHRAEATGVNSEHSLRRSTRKRKRIEPAPHMVPVVPNHFIRPPKRTRSITTTASKGKATAMADPKPAPSVVPLKTTDGRYACPHCPGRIFQRYHDCLRHIDTSKQCLGWNGVMYPCHRCGSKYTRRDAVKRHMDDKPNCA